MTSLETTQKGLYPLFRAPSARYALHLLRDRLPRLQAIVAGRKPPPIEVELIPTNACNSDCQVCLRPFVRDPKRELTSLSQEELGFLLDMIDDLSNSNEEGFRVEILKLGGGASGDPLANKHAAWTIAQAICRNYQVGVFSNGIRLTPAVVEAFGMSAGRPTHSYLHLSLNAATASTWGQYTHRNPKNFLRIISNFSHLANLREQRGLNVGLTIGFVITPINCDEVEAMVHLANDLGANVLRFRFDLTGFHPLMPEKEQEIMRTIQALREKEFFASHLTIVDPEKLDGQESLSSFFSSCFAQHLWTAIDRTALIPCPTNVNYTFGKVSPERDLRALWTASLDDEGRLHFPDSNTCPQRCSPALFSLNLVFQELVRVFGSLTSEAVQTAHTAAKEFVE